MIKMIIQGRDKKRRLYFTGIILLAIKALVIAFLLTGCEKYLITTDDSATGISFATDVVPVLGLCNGCHTHPWTTSPVAVTFYANLLSGGYVKPASPSTSKIYVKLNSGHGTTGVPAASINKIITWMNEGSLNN